jgi:hypothetical protein
MFAPQIRHATLAIAALVLATSINITPAAAAAAPSVDQTAVQTCTQYTTCPTARTAEPDLQVTPLDFKWVNGKFTYFYVVENVGKATASGVVLTREIQINYWGTEQYKNMVTTEYKVADPVLPGKKLPVQIECPATKYDTYCASATLYAVVTKLPYDTNLYNDAYTWKVNSKDN